MRWLAILYAKEFPDVGTSQHTILPQRQHEDYCGYRQAESFGSMSHLLAKNLEVERSLVGHEQQSDDGDANEGYPQQDQRARPPAPSLALSRTVAADPPP